MRADVGDGEDLALGFCDADGYAIDLDADRAFVADSRQRAGPDERGLELCGGCHVRLRASSSSTAAMSRCSTSGRPMRSTMSAKNPRTTSRRAVISSMPRDMR